MAIRNSRAARAVAGRGGAGRPGAAVVLSIVVFAEHFAWGANNDPLAIFFAAVWFSVLAVLLLQPGAGSALNDWRPAAIAVPFVLTLGLAGLALTPFALGGPNPIWGLVDGAVPVGSIAPYQTIVELLKLLALAAAFLAGCIVGANGDRFRQAMRAILIVGGLYSVWAILDHVNSPEAFLGSPRNMGPGRLAASFGSSNTAATLFGALTLLGLAELARVYRLRTGDPEDLFVGVLRPLAGLLVTTACLLLTFSRAGVLDTAIMAAALALATMLWRGERVGVAGWIVTPLLALAAPAVALTAIGNAAFQQRFLGIGSDADVRAQIFAAHWGAFLARPWGGYGLGSFQRINSMIMTPADALILSPLGAAHNVYLQWLEEAGAPAALAMFATVAVIAAILAVAAVRRRRGRYWTLGILAVLGLFLLHGADDFALQVPSMSTFLALLLGLGVGAAIDSSAKEADASVGQAGSQTIQAGSHHGEYAGRKARQG